jgi:hypothetical protein
MPAIGADVPNLFYVLGIPLLSMLVLGVIAVALFRGLGRLLP